MVIHNICIANDPGDNLLVWTWRPKPHFTWDGRRLELHDHEVRLSAARRALQWLADESHVFNRVRELVFGSDSLPVPQPKELPFDRHAANELTVRIACRVRDVARRGGADLLVLIHPDRFTFEHLSPLSIHIASALRENGIRVQDLAETYWAARLSYEQVALDGQGHLTPLAHHLVAEEIETLLQSGVPVGRRR